MQVKDIRTLVPTVYGDWLTKFEDTWKSQVEMLKQKFGDAIEQVHLPVEYPTEVPIVFVKKERIVEVLRFMKHEAGFEYDFLVDYTATDETPEDPRFHVVINLMSLTRMWRIRLKSKVAETEEFPSLMPLWAGADWCERELWDMYGIKFEGRPNLRRILMHEEWEGHPLRKDYPLRGYQVIPTAAVVHPEDVDYKPRPAEEWE